MRPGEAGLVCSDLWREKAGRMSLLGMGQYRGLTRSHSKFLFEVMLEVFLFERFNTARVCVCV